jgi:ABC-type transport system involved in multi-copper enzyme maturation permease subunit
MSYRIGLGIGVLGLLVFLVALLRSLAPFFSSMPERSYLKPAGLLLMLLGLLYGLVSLAFCSENRLVVMTRRELGAFFYSPIAYMVLFGFTVAHSLNYAYGASQIIFRPPTAPVPEPIVRLFFSIVVGVFFMFMLPPLTMRLLSEERRTGTLEVLLTTPVTETTVVLSKFLAAFVMFLIMWLPWGLLLIAFRIGGGKDFDYFPLISFTTGLLFTGAAFVSMGLFFSALTRNQIVSSVLTFVGLLFLTFVSIGAWLIDWLNRVNAPPGEQAGTSTWVKVLQHCSYLEIWDNTLKGKLELSYLLFPASLTIFFLFLSVKVLEARKWS